MLLLVLLLVLLQSITQLLQVAWYTNLFAAAAATPASVVML